MPYNFVAEFSHKETVADFLQAKENGRVFEPPLVGLRAIYDVHLGLTLKRVVDFLLLLIFFARRYGSGVTAQALRANID